MNKQFDERLLETTWQEIEFEIKRSKEIGPKPGFTNRWKLRLEERRKVEQRRQAWIFVGINAITALIILGIIGILNFPESSSTSEAFVGVVAIFSKFIVYLKMVGGVIGSIFRTLPGLLPSSWWMNIIAGFVLLFGFWTSTIRKVIVQQGVSQ